MHQHDPNPAAEAEQDTAPTEFTGSESPQEIEIAELKMALAQLREDTLRERADLENQRRRMARELDQARKFANERLLNELLPVLDSLHAGLKAAGGDEHPLKAGLELTLKQLLKTAADNGLTEVNPQGEAFSPEWHQAVTQVPHPTLAPGTVIDVFQRGYVLNERLLRPALVVVAADPAG